MNEKKDSFLKPPVAAPIASEVKEKQVIEPISTANHQTNFVIRP
jgi:hypothetical protein